MSPLKSRWFTLTTYALLTLVVAVGGILAFRAHARGVGKLLDSGDQACAAGTMALDGRDGAAACLHFQEAALYADNALQRLEQKRQELTDAAPEAIANQRQLEGEAFWLKMRALRGQGFARVLQDGKPVYTHDSTDDRDILDVTRLPDEKLRTETIICLREAALRLSENAEVLREAVRVEMQGDPAQWNWPLAENFANRLLKLAPNDGRALYLLARFHYEQPASSPGGKGTPGASTAVARRSRERMLRAREYLALLKKSEPISRWRTLQLEGQVTQWLMRSYGSPQNPRPEMERQERERLRGLLLDDDTGALARAARGESLAKASRLDADGILALHQMALELVCADLRRNDSRAVSVAKEGGPQLEAFRRVLEQTRAVGERLLADRDVGTARLAEVAEAETIALLTVQPFLSLNGGGEWAQAVAAQQALVERVADRKAGSMALYLGLANLLGAEAELAARQGQTARQVELRQQALQAVAIGLKVALERKLAPAQTLALHELAARFKVVAGARREDLAQHLRALQEATVPSARAAAFLLEGALAEREGRLERARDFLEKATRLTSGTIAERAHTVLANIYLALGQSDQALASLQVVERVYARLDKLSDEEKTWVQEFVRSPNELMLMEVQAHLGAARRLAAVRQAASNLRQDPQPARMFAAHEDEARKRIAGLPERSPVQRAARQEWVAYLAATGQRAPAEKALASLKTDYPDSVGVLRLEIGWLLQTAGGEKPDGSRQQAENCIRQFLADYPDSVPGRLFWAEWLTATGRGRDAALYLEDPANFPDAKGDRRHDRALARAFLSAGEKDKLANLIATAASNPAGDSAMLAVAAGGGNRNQEGDELARHESSGMVRCWNAGLAYGRRDYADAARGFLGAIEFTRYRAAARQGLRASLLAMAQDDPEKARDLIVELLQEHSAEPALLLPYAFACLLLDEIGSPNDTGDRIKDMCSALRALETVLARSEQDPVAGPMTNAQFWLLANRPDYARVESLRALKMNPRHEPALWLAARLAVEADDPALVNSAGQYLAALKELQPDSPQVALLVARQQERSNQLSEAASTYRTLLDRTPIVEAYAGLTALLEKQGSVAEAESLVAEWRTKLPDSLAAVQSQIRQLLERGKPEEARAAAEQFLDEQLRKQEAQRRQVSTPVAAGGSAAGNRGADGAAELRVRLTLGLAEAFDQGQAWSDAAKWLLRVLHEQPNSEPAHLLLGNCYLHQLTSAGGLSPGARQALVSKARDEFCFVYNKRKGHLVAGNNLAWLLARECGEPDEALRIAQEVRLGAHSRKPLAGDRLPIELVDTFGQIYTLLNNPELATEMRELFESARQRYPSDPRLYLYLGNAYALLQNSARANRMFQTAAALAGPQGKSSVLSAAKREATLEAAQAAQRKLGGGMER